VDLLDFGRRNKTKHPRPACCIRWSSLTINCCIDLRPRIRNRDDVVESQIPRTSMAQVSNELFHPNRYVRFCAHRARHAALGNGVCTEDRSAVLLCRGDIGLDWMLFLRGRALTFSSVTLTVSANNASSDASPSDTSPGDSTSGGIRT
jgi:hypothetical protein